MPSHDPAPDEAAASTEVREALERAIGTLDPIYREVLLLRDAEGLTAPEVAEVLGIGVEAVKSRLHRARVAVRRHLAPALVLPSGETAASSCPEIAEMFSRYLEDEISAERCVEMQRHLDGCTRCRDACDALKRTLVLCRTSTPAIAVPASVQASVKRAIRHFLAIEG